MANHRQINAAGLDLIKKFEALKLEAYRCSAGVLTIGYGHTKNVKEGDVITEAQADELLRQDVADAERAVSDLVKVPMNENEFSALVSLVFNIGRGHFRTSTALRKLNEEKRTSAGEAMTWWNNATIDGVLTRLEGLVRRRKAERDLFFKPVD